MFLVGWSRHEHGLVSVKGSLHTYMRLHPHSQGCTYRLYYLVPLSSRNAQRTGKKKEKKTFARTVPDSLGLLVRCAEGTTYGTT